MDKTKGQEIAELRQTVAALIAENEKYVDHLARIRDMMPEEFDDRNADEHLLAISAPEHVKDYVRFILERMKEALK
ncbi:hypothetical protein [Bacillus altitudinis]|uniref:hypothetical protein n=1 Tax=Bacillus altitudinis TaxID=293387 RepID=UPI0022824763|nr:hypothetical protein [Bacillus altitudinis]MCY7439376.1 hypothetical protein [Bacillus altitudinis]MEC1142414.1 hypothetical protein [Bacillus altitudinis]